MKFLFMKLLASTYCILYMIYSLDVALALFTRSESIILKFCLCLLGKANVFQK